MIVERLIPPGYVASDTILFSAVGDGWIYISAQAPSPLDIYIDGTHFRYITPQNYTEINGIPAFSGSNTYYFHRTALVVARPGSLPGVKISAVYR